MDTINTLLNFLLENGRACEVFCALSLFVGIAIGLFWERKKTKILTYSCLTNDTAQKYFKVHCKKGKIIQNGCVYFAKGMCRKINAPCNAADKLVEF